MFVCKLKCCNCDYESEHFVEGYSVHCESHTILCVDRTTNRIRIATLANSHIPEGAETDGQIEAIVLCEGEDVLKTTFGQAEQLPVRCPLCNHKGLRKEILGLD